MFVNKIVIEEKNSPLKSEVFCTYTIAMKAPTKVAKKL